MQQNSPKSSSSPSSHQITSTSSPSNSSNRHQQESSAESDYYHHYREIKYKITSNDLKNFRVAYTSDIQDETDIKTIDFSANGSIGLFNTNNNIKFVWLELENPHEQTCKLSEYGAGHCRFLNPFDRIVHTSTKVDDNLRIFNVRKNEYDTYFKGHTAEVTGIDIFKLFNNNFVSSSMDNTVKFWDIRENKFIKSISFNKHQIIACHPTEMDVVVASQLNSTTYGIQIYDFRSGSDDDCPIIAFNVEDQESPWTVMKFSNDGKYLMINTESSLTILIDLDSGTQCRRLHGYDNSNNQPIETCFTPDSKFILGGSQDGKVHIWDSEENEKIILEKTTPGPIHKIMFNPELMCFATAGEKFHLWIEKE